jgi:membrane carboxypeptidase/penicillin-binding protein PbpC
MKPEAATQRGVGDIMGRGSFDEPSPSSHTSRIEIVSPHNRDRFILSRHRASRIVFRALPERVVEHVVWFLNGTELGKSGPPYEFIWEPTRGIHELLAVTPDKTAAKATFFVE